MTLVGKGVCFDTGGLDIKPSAGMALMKKDMGGAACALALARLVMEAQLPVRLRVLIPAVENAIAGNAYRPGDVLRTRKGLTVEIGNTDAEGRLVLCDAIALRRRRKAGADDRPGHADRRRAGGARPGTAGGVRHAPGDRRRAAAARSPACATRCGRCRCGAATTTSIASKVADLNNASASAFAGAIIGALFLRRFVTRRRTGCTWTCSPGTEGAARPARSAPRPRPCARSTRCSSERYG